MKTGLTLEMNVRQILLTFTTEKFEVLLIPHSLLSFIYTCMDLFPAILESGKTHFSCTVPVSRVKKT